MQKTPSCPACGETVWQTLGNRTYRTEQIGRMSPNVNKRLVVLFKVWFPGKESVTLTSVVCEGCGFVCFTPRPSEDDINAKYKFLSTDPETGNEISLDLASDEPRAADICQRLHPFLPKQASILNFGGGNGRLLRPFILDGHRCYLVDYPGEILPSIYYMGATLSNIPIGQRFDVIICSHVLEHLADPYVLVANLKHYLLETGTLYVEVPVEIWKHPPLPIEPVTHINYFTPASLLHLLERAGLDVFSCKEGLYTTEEGGTGKAIRAFARTGIAPHHSVPSTSALRQTLGYLEPSILVQLVHAFKYPRLTKQVITMALRKRLSHIPFLWRLVASKHD
ncbi:MAG: class I SAM-dependent methyltransferase [Gallionella sp.]